MKFRKFQKHFCFALGMAGAVVALAGGALMLAGFGQAQYMQMASFVLTGAMLLFLGAMEKGPEKKALRAKLLVLFFVLVVSYLGLPQRLPPLDLLEILVLPCLAGLYAKKGKNDGLWITALVLFEITNAAVRTLTLTPLLGGQAQALRIWGGATVLVALLRGIVLLRLYRRTKAEAPAQEGGQTRLR